MWGFLKLTTSVIGFGAALFGANSLPHKSGLALRDAGLYIKSATPSIPLPTMPWPPVEVVGVYNQCMRLNEDDAGELFAKVILCELLRPYVEESMLQTAIAHVAIEKPNTNANIDIALEIESVVVIVVVPKPTPSFDLPGTPTRLPTFTIKMLFLRVVERAMGLLRRFLKPVIWCVKMVSTCASKTCPAVAVPVLPEYGRNLDLSANHDEPYFAEYNETANSICTSSMDTSFPTPNAPNTFPMLAGWIEGVVVRLVVGNTSEMLAKNK